ncbi:branched-chain amino acid transport system substrate-binding protein [Inquilinus ginsengisoli]
MGRGRSRLNRLVRLAGAAAMAAALAACAQTVPRPTPITQAPTLAPNAPTRPDDGVLRVGLLLPLSGGSASLGEAMQRAAQMAVFDTGTQVELLPRDTGDNPATAGEAARSVIAQGADIILGPLFSKSVSPVAQQARSAGINVVAFSTDTAQAGGNVFLMSFLPQQAIDRIVGYGASQGMRRFALLAPRSAYGQIVSRALTEAAVKYNVEAPVIELYDSKLSDPTELQQKLQATQVDAVIVADVGNRLSVVAPMLGYSGITAKLMGTGQWDDPQVNRQSYLAGAWYAAPDPSRRADFESRYAQQFGGPPPRLATLAYDAVALTASLASQPASGNPFNATALQDPNGFVGIDGIFRFGPNGLVQRGLAVLEAQPTGPTVVESAPDSFSGAAF